MKYDSIVKLKEDRCYHGVCGLCFVDVTYSSLASFTPESILLS